MDLEGRTLDDDAAAVAKAVVEARALISADALTGHISLAPTIEVAGNDRQILHVLKFEHAVVISR